MDLKYTKRFASPLAFVLLIDSELCACIASRFQLVLCSSDGKYLVDSGPNLSSNSTPTCNFPSDSSKPSHERVILFEHTNIVANSSLSNECDGQQEIHEESIYAFVNLHPNTVNHQHSSCTSMSSLCAGNHENASAYHSNHSKPLKIITLSLVVLDSAGDTVESPLCVKIRGSQFEQSQTSENVVYRAGILRIRSEISPLSHPSNKITTAEWVRDGEPNCPGWNNSWNLFAIGSAAETPEFGQISAENTESHHRQSVVIISPQLPHSLSRENLDDDVEGNLIVDDESDLEAVYSGIRNVLKEKGRREMLYALELKQLRPLFRIPRDIVAKRLGICVTLFKKICRRHGVEQWPYRKLKTLDSKIRSLVEQMEASSDEEVRSHNRTGSRKKSYIQSQIIQLENERFYLLNPKQPEDDISQRN